VSESVAHKCILSATWAARVVAILTLTPLLDAFLRPRSAIGLDWTLVTVTITLTAALFFLAERVKRGGRLAALTLLVGTLWAHLGNWLHPSERPYPSEGSFAEVLGPILEFLAKTIFISCFALGLWGTFALARARAQREAGYDTATNKYETLPSKARRVMVISLYSFAAACILPIIGSFTSAQCFSSGLCTDPEWRIWSLASLGWMGLSYLFIVLGWQGRLLGCRA
jgi:hypothetical protein